jgi:hypothetical protein
MGKKTSPDGMKYNEYVLMDKKRGFLFEAGSYVAMDSHIILYHKKRWDQYSRDLMRYYHDDVMRIAARYGIRLIPPLREMPDVPVKSRSPVWPLDSVFIASPGQLDTVVDLYAELANLYSFTYVRYHKNETKNPKLVLCYLPENEPDRSKNVKICHLPYLNFRLENGVEPPDTDRENDAALENMKCENYIPAKHEVREALCLSWNKAVDRGRITQEKVECAGREAGRQEENRERDAIPGEKLNVQKK